MDGKSPVLFILPAPSSFVTADIGAQAVFNLVGRDLSFHWVCAESSLRHMFEGEGDIFVLASMEATDEDVERLVNMIVERFVISKEASHDLPE